MPIEVSLRKTVHRKSWEYLAPTTVANSAGACIVSDKFNLIKNNPIFLMSSYSGIFRYDGHEDGFVGLPNSGLAGTFGAGACMELRALGAMGGVFNQTSVSGTSTTISTNKTIVTNLAGIRLVVISGTGVGYDNVIVSNTIGTNSVITVTPVAPFTFDSTTVFRIYSGSLWAHGAGASAGFSVYDIATNVWNARATIGTTFGTDGQLVSTIGASGAFSTNDATSGSSNTIVDNTKTWTSGMWVNYQVRIYEGAGIGQIRTISSNSATTLTVSSNWTVTPDSTSKFKIEGNDDFFYLLGNNNVTLYKFTVSTNTWATVSPVAARQSNPGGGLTANWIDSVESWELPTSGTPTLMATGLYQQNGRYIFSFRGNVTNILDIYDIAGNTWISNVPYGGQFETFTSGSSNCDYKGNIYIQKEATGRIFKFSVKDWSLQAFNTSPAVQGSATVGNKMCIISVKDGDELSWLYSIVSSQFTFMRVLII